MVALFLKVLLFIAFLLPVTIGSFSVNYAFLFYALFLAIKARRLERPGNLLLVAILAYSAIYLVGLGFDIVAPEAMLLRRGVSYAIFMTMFAFALVPFGPLETKAFKIAIVAVALGFSIYAITRFYSVGGNNYGFALKDVTGSQRYGFVYLMAIFCLMTTSSAERWFLAGRAIALFVILAGLMLTFSRTSIVSLGLVMPLFIIAPLALGPGRAVARLLAMGRRAGIAAIYSAVLFAAFPIAFQYYGELILLRYAPLVGEILVSVEPAEQAGQEVLGDGGVLTAEGSEGTRLAIWQEIVANTLENPLTGSSYLGVWNLNEISAGSAHSQYFDVLQRTGFLGALLYIAILGQVLFFLWRKEPGLFWGTLAMLVFGLFHETFKESQGAFILACLLGMYGAHRREVAESGRDAATPASLRA